MGLETMLAQGRRGKGHGVHERMKSQGLSHSSMIWASLSAVSVYKIHWATAGFQLGRCCVL